MVSAKTHLEEAGKIKDLTFLMRARFPRLTVLKKSKGWGEVRISTAKGVEEAKSNLPM